MIGWEDLDPQKVREAKEKAGGPLGQELARYPLRFCVPITFGTDPHSDLPLELQNASVSLVRLGGKEVGVTCHHVIESFRRLRSTRSDAAFQVGNVGVDLDARLIAEDEGLDLAVLDLANVSLERVAIGPELGFFEPPRWPPKPVVKEDFVTLAGYPGTWRHEESVGELGYGSLSLGLTPVTSISVTGFGCLFERQHWIPSIGPVSPQDIRDLGGMSGGPVFLHRETHFEWVGVIYEYSSEFDILLVRQSGVLGLDGVPNRS